MKTLIGEILESLPLGDLRWKRDLVYFDGPLLSEYDTEKGETYLKYWCDCNKTHNRWLYFKIKEQDRLRLVYGDKSIKEVMVNQPDLFFFLADEGTVGNRYQMVEGTNLPPDYYPTDDSYLDIEDYEEDLNTTSLIFEDQWDFEELKDIYRKFTQIYDFIFVANGGLNRFGSAMPWQGGFSAVHFYNKIRDIMGVSDRSKLDAIHYASPGYMKIKANTDTSNLALEAIRTYADKKDEVDKYYLELQNRIKELGLNGKSPNSAVNEFSSDQQCLFYFNNLKSLLSISSPWLNDFVDTDFERAKIIQAHIRRLRYFYSFISERNVRVVSRILSES